MPMPNPGRVLERTAWVSLPVHTVLCGALLPVGEGVLLSLDPAAGGSPIGIFIGAAFMTILGLMIGIPFRLARPLIRWWLCNGTATWCFLGVSVLIAASSFFVGSAATTRRTMDVPPPTVVHAPDPIVFGIGWVLLAVALTHLWWPYRFLSPSMRATLDAARWTRTPLPGPIGRR